MVDPVVRPSIVTRFSASNGNFIVWGLLIVVLTFAVYSPVLGAGYIWDDDDYLTENPLIDQPGGLAKIWLTDEAPQYYPLYFTSFWLEYRLWGDHPGGYHAVNVLLHALNAFLAGLILRELKFKGAWWVALAFALHPVHVESVAWITERKNTLSALFYLMSVWSYLIYDRTDRRRLWYWALVAFVAALLSKTATFAAPFAIAAFLACRHGRIRRADLSRLAPFVALAVLVPWVTLRLESGMVDAVRGDFAWSFGDRVAVAARAIWFYPWKLLLPYPLIFNYPRWELSESLLWRLAPVLPGLLAGLATIWAWRTGRRAVATAIAFYAINVFPALGFFDVYAFRYSFVADHWNYLSSLGVLALIVMTGLAIGKRLTPTIAAGTALVLLGILACLTWNQTHAYQDEETLWRDTISKNPQSWIANNNLATKLLGRGEPTEALELYRAAVAAKPQAEESYTGVGLTLAELGRKQEALVAFNQAVELNPSYPQARINRGDLYRDLGRYAEAVQDLTVFLDANPDYVPAYRSRAMAYIGLRKPELAILDGSRAIELGAGPDGYNDRGGARLLAGDYEGAVEDFGQAISGLPDDTSLRANRAVALARLGRYAEARADLDVVIASGSAPAAAYNLRGRALFETTGDRVAACADFSQACERGDCRAFEANCSAK